MVYLGDYLGQLLAELTTARLHSDAEAVRVGELYASHPLLKHFPVPRMRVGQIEMEIPVSVVRVDESGGSNEAKQVTALELLERFRPLLKAKLEQQAVSLSSGELDSLFVQLQRTAQNLVRPKLVSVDSNQIADHFCSVVQNAIGGLKMHESKAQLISDQLRLAARVDFLNARPTGPRLVVGVTTAELKESPPESLVRISIRVSEDGVAWTNVADESNPDMRLMPE